MGHEKLLLVMAEWPDQVGTIDPPTAQRLAGGLVFTDQLTAGIEADPVAVEQPLAVIAVAPWLDVARHQELLPPAP